MIVSIIVMISIMGMGNGDDNDHENGDDNDHEEENNGCGGQAVEIAKGEAAGGFHKGFGQLPEGSAVCRPEGEGCNQEI